LHLTELFEKSANQMGVKTVRRDDDIDISVIYGGSMSYRERGQEAPIVRLYWEGWEDLSRTSDDLLNTISLKSMKEAGRTLALSLMILGRETNY